MSSKLHWIAPRWTSDALVTSWWTRRRCAMANGKQKCKLMGPWIGCREIRRKLARFSRCSAVTPCYSYMPHLNNHQSSVEAWKIYYRNWKMYSSTLVTSLCWLIGLEPPVMSWKPWYAMPPILKLKTTVLQNRSWTFKIRVFEKTRKENGCIIKR